MPTLIWFHVENILELVRWSFLDIATDTIRDLPFWGLYVDGGGSASMDNFYGSNGIFCFRPKRLKLDVKPPTSDIKAHPFSLTLAPVLLTKS